MGTRLCDVHDVRPFVLMALLLYVKAISNPLRARNPKTGSLANSEGLDEMLHNAAFHQGLHC